MGYPDFACMGFQKCGTTTLFDILKHHSQVVLCQDVKEPMYYRLAVFDTLGGHHWFYRNRYFCHVREGDPRLKGEINAGLTFSGCAKKISRDFSPETKMIFMMRNPADRSYSAYKYFLARGYLPPNIISLDAKLGHPAAFDIYVHRVLGNPARRKKIMRERQAYLVFSQSNYASCVHDYLNKFDIKNMKFIVFEEFIKDQHAACREIYDFLGIDDEPDIDYGEKANEGNERAVSAGRSILYMVMKSLRYFFYDICYMTHWAPWLFELFMLLYRLCNKICLAPDRDTRPMLPRTREYLMRYYAPQVREMERLTGKDLGTIWNQRK
ncbi:MAG: sulfotransferase domain-containing protein [Clostridiales bacterium]|nr:sulfotransferase domain-containing protein [Clostridiales bacterium]